MERRVRACIELWLGRGKQIERSNCQCNISCALCQWAGENLSSSSFRISFVSIQDVLVPYNASLLCLWPGVLGTGRGSLSTGRLSESHSTRPQWARQPSGPLCQLQCNATPAHRLSNASRDWLCMSTDKESNAK
jgi:hypothetical protein